MKEEELAMKDELAMNGLVKNGLKQEEEKKVEKENKYKRKRSIEELTKGLIEELTEEEIKVMKYKMKRTKTILEGCTEYLTQEQKDFIQEEEEEQKRKKEEMEYQRKRLIEALIKKGWIEEEEELKQEEDCRLDFAPVDTSDLGKEEEELAKEEEGLEMKGLIETGLKVEEEEKEKKYKMKRSIEELIKKGRIEGLTQEEGDFILKMEYNRKNLIEALNKKGWIESEEEDSEELEWTVKMDKLYNLLKLLSSGTNTGLLVNSRGEVFSFDQLKSKYVLLYFWCLPDHHEPNLNLYKPEEEFNWDLEENYDLYRQDFEVVFVALGNNEDVFRETFSAMPWLAIPHKDQEARDYFKKKFAIPDKAYDRAVLFAPNGRVVSANAEPLFTCYGAHGFPFITESIEKLLNECDDLERKIFEDKNVPSLTELLGECVIFFPRDGDKVPTSKLDCKIVGLYFFEPTPKGVQCTRQLLDVWNSLTDKQRESFEIVIINKAPYNLYNAKAEFKKNFGTAIPWYWVEVCGRKLCRVFHRNSRDDCITGIDGEGDLIVLKPDMYEQLSYFAFNILVKYGSDAYPFTLQIAVELAKREQQKQLMLGNLLSPDAPLRRGVSSTRYKADRVDTTVSELLGKRVLLLFATSSCCESRPFLLELKRMYEKKGTDDDFEIIYISLDCDESPSSFPKSIKGMPWLVHTFVQHFGVVLAHLLFGVFPPQLPAIAAFEPDGHLQTKESNLAFKNDFKSEYPFIQADMDEEVKRELIYQYRWDLESLVSGGFF